MFYPQKTETISSAYSYADVQKKIEVDIRQEVEGKKYWFKGKVQDDMFTLSLLLKRPNNFTPVISGILDKEENGKALIVVKYELFPTTKRFLVFWTVLTILLTLFFIIPYQAYLYGAITFSACLVNYIIARENFNIQVRKSRRALLKVIGATE